MPPTLLWLATKVKALQRLTLCTKTLCGHKTTLKARLPPDTRTQPLWPGATVPRHIPWNPARSICMHASSSRSVSRWLVEKGESAQHGPMGSAALWHRGRRGVSLSSIAKIAPVSCSSDFHRGTSSRCGSLRRAQSCHSAGRECADQLFWGDGIAKRRASSRCVPRRRLACYSSRKASGSSSTNAHCYYY